MTVGPGCQYALITPTDSPRTRAGESATFRCNLCCMIRPCSAADLPTIFAIVNDAAEAYRGVIPADRWHEPYKKNGFRLLSRAETKKLLRKYWNIPERQIESSVVLANRAWTAS